MARTTTRNPLAIFLSRSKDLAVARDNKKGWAKDNNVTIEYLVGIYHGQNGKCFHTGEPMTLVRGLVEKAVVFDLCTIDRIDNEKGYVVGNIILCCDGINRMRRDMPLKQFQALCKRIGMRA
jgi:hypothetical protein